MQPVVIGDVIWEPDPETVARSRLRRFMDRHGIGSFQELIERSTTDLEWYWDAVVHDVGLAFYKGYDAVLDQSDGVPWTRWFPGSTPHR